MATEHASYPGRSNGAPIKQWDGAMPIIMSLTVLMMVAFDLWKHGLHAAHHDESGADHLAMLLMFGQIPIMFWFTRPGAHRIRSILPVLMIQLSLWAITFASAVALT